MAYAVIPTLAGKDAIADALDNGTPIVIAEMVVGDGNGSPVTPLETQTALVNLRETLPIESSVRVGNFVTFKATIDENTGGFYIREVGLLDDNGVLLFVGSYPETLKETTAENAFDTLTIGIKVVIASTATVLLQPPPGTLVSVAEMVRAPHITVDSMTTTAPPGSPGDGATYVVPTGATGAWSGHTAELAQWNGSAWVFKSVPTNHLVGVSSTGQFFKRTVSGWQEVFLPLFNVNRAALLFFGSI